MPMGERKEDSKCSSFPGMMDRNLFITVSYRRRHRSGRFAHRLDSHTPLLIVFTKTRTTGPQVASMVSSNGYERLPMYAPLTTHRRRFLFLPLRTTFSKPRLTNTHRSRSRSPTRPKSRFHLKPRSLFTILKYLIPTIVSIVLLGFYFYEPHIEIAFYDRTWVSKEIEPVSPLSGCFHESRVSRNYNVSRHVYGPKRTEVQAGMSMRMGLDCYDFAGTITTESSPRPIDVALEDRTHFHTYWRSDLAPFGPRQEWMLKSFFATQHLPTSRLILWSNGDLSSNEILQSYLRRYPSEFALKIVKIPTLARGTSMEGSLLLSRKDAKAWVDGDLIRLLLLWNFGGVWVDMDSLLTRDLEPLLEHEFVSQWDCYGASFLLTSRAQTNESSRQNLSPT